MQWYVGNDLVDLIEKENGDRPQNVRFVHRVLAAEERRPLDESSDKVTTFAILWSGKEAAYKILKKVDSSLLFSHSKFVVSINKGRKAPNQLEGHVSYKEHQIPMSWEINPKWVHGLAHYSLEGQTSEPSFFSWRLDTLDAFSPDDTNFTLQEKGSIHSHASSSVRMQAKKMLQNEGENSIELIRPMAGKKFGPPQIWQEGTQLEKWDISMSHDGSFVASALIRG
jgi:phosphopantetheinyl transferase (holo-ACP synthase)